MSLFKKGKNEVLENFKHLTISLVLIKEMEWLILEIMNTRKLSEVISMVSRRVSHA